MVKAEFVLTSCCIVQKIMSTQMLIKATVLRQESCQFNATLSTCVIFEKGSTICLTVLEQTFIFLEILTEMGTSLMLFLINMNDN